MDFDAASMIASFYSILAAHPVFVIVVIDGIIRVNPLFVVVRILLSFMARMKNPVSIIQLVCVRASVVVVRNMFVPVVVNEGILI